MAVLLETNVGDMVIDLYTDDEKNKVGCQNFLKLCKIKYFHNCLFYSVQKNFVAFSGDPSNTGNDGECIYTLLQKNIEKNAQKKEEKQVEEKNDFEEADETNKKKEAKDVKYIRGEINAKLKHNKIGIVGMQHCVANANEYIGSRFYITLSANLSYLDGKYVIIGEVSEGVDILKDQINNVYVDEYNHPIRAIRIRRTGVLDDPYEDIEGMHLFANIRSPEPIVDEDFSPFKKEEEELAILHKIHEKEAKSRAITLEILGDIPDADIRPPDNVLFICRLNPCTQDDDLRTIFARFGRIISCVVIKDWKTGDSLQYGFIEFEDKKACENAYFKMQDVLVDDRRIHVDFCQSASQEWRRFKKFGALGGGKEEEEEDTHGGKKDKNKFNFFQEKQRGKGRTAEEKNYSFVFEEKTTSHKLHTYHPRQEREKEEERAARKKHENRRREGEERRRKEEETRRREEEETRRRKEEERRKRKFEEEIKKRKTDEKMGEKEQEEKGSERGRRDREMRGETHSHERRKEDKRRREEEKRKEKTKEERKEEERRGEKEWRREREASIGERRADGRRREEKIEERTEKEKNTRPSGSESDSDGYYGTNERKEKKKERKIKEKEKKEASRRNYSEEEEEKRREKKSNSISSSEEEKKERRKKKRK